MIANFITDYPLFYGQDAWSGFKHWLGQAVYSQVLVLCDEHTHEHCWPIVQAKLGLAGTQCITIPAGEVHKNIETCQYIWSEMAERQLDRKALLLNLGGGVIGDMGGFCAATWKRGIDFVQIPTTLLSMVDASVGGKLGVDFKHLKNMLGLFQHPAAIVLEPQFLRTLSPRERMSGFAEMLKHALLDSPAHFDSLLQLDVNQLSTEHILASIAVKQGIVAQDPHESGPRKALNLGHTIGHAIESYYLAQGRYLLHGEAVAWGLVAELYIAVQNLGFPEADWIKIKDYVQANYPALQDVPVQPILDFAKQDKKNSQGQIRAALLRAIGHATWDEVLDDETLRASLGIITAI